MIKTTMIAAVIALIAIAGFIIYSSLVCISISIFLFISFNSQKK